MTPSAFSCRILGHRGGDGIGAERPGHPAPQLVRQEAEELSKLVLVADDDDAVPSIRRCATAGRSC